MKKRNLYSKKELLNMKTQNAIFNEEQMQIINSLTPKTEIEIKTDVAGRKYKSVKASYMKKLLMAVTGGNYNFEIKSKEFSNRTNEAIVEARLTLLINGNSFFRDQFGQFSIKTKPLTDIGNAYKSACSDAFKKCCSEFQFCWDVYSHTLPEITTTNTSHGEKKKIERLIHFLSECNTADEIERIYEKFLETAPETTETKNILKAQMQRVLE